MKERAERKIRNKKVMIALMEYIVTLGCLLVAFVMISGKKIEQTSSYAKPEEVTKYEVVEDKYLTRVRPLTEYETFKEIAKNSLNKVIRVYKDESKTEEVIDGIITSGMVVEAESEGEIAEPTENRSYEVRVIGDLNNDGDSSVIELTKIIRHVVGVERIERRAEEISGDFNGDDKIDVVDITMCIRYIVYGEMEGDKDSVIEPKIEVKEIGEEEERDNNWYNGDVEVRIVEQGEGTLKIETGIERNGRRQTTEERKITLTREGTYLITSQSYGENGTKSRVVEREINIDKTIPELEISREDIDMTQCKIVIKARDNGGIRKYSVQREGEEERSKEGINEKEISGYVTIRENGKYKIVIEDQAGNKVEKEIEITDLNNRYTVTFKNEDESIISEKDYEQGARTEIPQNPSKQEDNIYIYEFAGWNPEVQETVTENKEYTATYSATYKNYTVTFKDENGNIVSTKNDYHYGDTVTVPENPSKAEDNTYTYRFIGWNKEVSTEVVENVEYKAVYEATRKEYTITFRDENGNILTEKTDYHYGDTVAVPQNPTKQEDNTYTYEFTGWKTTNEQGQETIVTPEEITSEAVNKNKEYTATYSATYKNYTVTFKDENGEVLSNKTDYHYGDTVAVPQSPTKQEDETYIYEFVGWNQEVQETVTENKEYTATYTSTYKNYAVTFKDENGNILTSKTDYHYGDTVAVPQNPTKAEDETYTYEFAGWSPEIQETVTRNKEYTATYRAIYKNYTVTFKDENGTIITTKNDYHYGDTVTVPENPTKAEDNTNTYEFAGWNQEVQETVTENKEYIATYTSTYKNYTVTFKDENGNILTSKTDYHYGDTVAVPQNPTKAEDETYTYEFAGWSPEVQETVTRNKEYTATYRSTYKNYTVTFKDENGTVITTKSDYHYGDTVTVPENPSKAEDNTYTYEFKGWTPEIVITEEQELKVTGNIEYVASYEIKYKEYTVTFKQDSGEIINSINYHYGDSLAVPENPSKKSSIDNAYKFVGWTNKNGEIVELTDSIIITENIEYTAKYEEEVINYNLVFYNDDDSYIETRTYKAGETISFPIATKEPDEEKTYIFDSWVVIESKEVTPTQIDIKFKAQYEGKLFVVRLEATEELPGKVYLSLEEAIQVAEKEERTITILQDIETKNAIIEDNQNIKLNLNGKTITGERNNTINNYGKLFITDNSNEKGGVIENTKDIAIRNNGELILGEDDGVIVNEITIKGKNVAVENNKDFYMYDNTLIAEINTVTGNSPIIPEDEDLEYGISVQEKDGLKIATIQSIVIPEAIVGDTYYLSLQDAINENNNTTITVAKKNVKLRESLIVDETKNLTIDLNGNAITQTNKSSSEYVLRNSGILTITNSNENIESNIINEKGYGLNNTNELTIEGININTSSIGIDNTKNLNVENVNIKGSIQNKVTTNDINFNMLKGKITSENAIDNSNRSSIMKIIASIKNSEINGNIRSKAKLKIESCLINNNGIGISTSGELILKDSKVTTKNCRNAISLTGDVVIENTQIEMDSVDSYEGGICCSNEYNVIIDKASKISVKGASKEAKVIGANGINSNTSSKVEMRDGSIIIDSGNGISMESGTFDFLGGSIEAGNQTISGTIGKIPDGKIIQTIKENDKYISTLIDEDINKIVASTEDREYYSIKQAVNDYRDSEESVVIVMQSDYDLYESIEITERHNIILDLNGYTINTNGEFVNKGKLQIKDSSEEKSGNLIIKSSRAVFNKENAELVINSGNIILGVPNMSQIGIYNTDNAKVEVIEGNLKSDNQESNTSKIFIYNLSTGNLEIKGGNIQGNSPKYGVIYGIYNYIDFNGGDRNVNISGGKINISNQLVGNIYGIYNHIYNTYDIKNTDSDTININIYNYNINLYGSSTMGFYGIYNDNSDYYEKDTINVNLNNNNINVVNSDYHGSSYGILNKAANRAGYIYNNIMTGNISATGGYNNNDCYGIYSSGNKTIINLGNEEFDNIETLNIFGKKCGIYNAKGNKVNFYQGIIKGTTAISEQTLLNIKEDKEINRYIDENDNYDTITLKAKTPEAKIGETTFMSLQDAINSIEENQEEVTTIELIKNIDTAANTITIEENKKIILDLKGYTITSLGSNTILNNGKLNIVNSEENAQIINKTNTAISNYGELNIENIKITGSSSGIINYKNGKADLNQVDIYAYIRGIYNYGECNVQNGEILVENNDSTYTIYNQGGITNIRNSNITAIYTGSQPDYCRACGIYTSSGNVSIGEKNSTEIDISKITSTNIGVYGKINYYGGTIEGGENAIQGSIGDTPTNKTIYVEDEDKKVSLIDKEEKVVAKIGESEFNSLAQAVQSVEENKEEYTEIQLVNNSEISTTEEEINISENQKIKLDLNGNTVTSYRNSVINNKGQLEVLDSSELKEGKLESAFRACINNQGDFVLDSGNINGVVYCIYNTKGNIEIKGGTLELNSKDRSNTTAIYAESQTDDVKLLGGNIECRRDRLNALYENSSYLAALFVKNTNLEIDGTNIYVENSTNYYTYGIISSKSNINIKSGDIDVRSTSGAGTRTYGIAGRSIYDNEDGNNINISGGNIVTIGRANIDTICLRSYYDTDKLTITGGKIESSGTVITAYPRKNNISVDFKGGTIISTNGSGIYGNIDNTYGTSTEITIGTKDGNVIKENPYIDCKYTAVLGDNVSFYDGTIKAATAFSKMPTDIEPGYKVNISTKDDIQTAKLGKIGTAEAKAGIGSLYFNDLQQAINACSETDTIKLLASNICTEVLKIEEGKTVTIDLMGNDLIASGIDNIIENYGTLNIIDSVGGGNIKGNIDNHGTLNR